MGCFDSIFFTPFPLNVLTKSLMSLCRVCQTVFDFVTISTTFSDIAETPFQLLLMWVWWHFWHPTHAHSSKGSKCKLPRGRVMLCWQDCNVLRKNNLEGLNNLRLYSVLSWQKHINMSHMHVTTNHDIYCLCKYSIIPLSHNSCFTSLYLSTGSTL